MLHRPAFQLPCRIPEHPLVATGSDEGLRDPGFLGKVEVLASLIGEVEDGSDERTELLATVGLYPRFV